MPLKAVFLDLGNTLVQERTSRAELYARGGRAHGLEVDAARMAELMAAAHRELTRVTPGGDYRFSDGWFREFQRRIFVERLGLAPGRFEALSSELFECFQQAETFRVLPGARALLADLRARGLALGLISNWSERLPALLAALDLERAFDLVLGSAQERLEKPDRELFERALERTGVAPAEALHAGDDLERDVAGARGAGIAAVLVDHAGACAGAVPCPVVRSLGELHDLVLGRLT